MKEITFIRQNLQKWEQSETIIENADSESPDRLAEVYIDLTADLSFAQTHYPESSITAYLNDLSAALHNVIYRNKREPRSRLITFWTHEVPLTMYRERRLLLASLIIFTVSVLIGIISQQADPDFCRTVLGGSYVDMTENNIAQGKPMGVYGQEPSLGMFHGITFNNVGVSFRIFVSGLLTSLATGVILFYNGIMIGCFDTFFAQRGMLGLCLTTTMLHGTLELSAIIVAGAAGLAMGNSWLFSGTLPRLEAFRRGARRGLKIVVGTVPVFIVAAFIESYITRHVELPQAVKLTIIAISALFVLFYFVAWPQILGHKNKMK